LKASARSEQQGYDVGKETTLYALVTLNGNNDIIPSDYTFTARAEGLDIITWTFERSGLLSAGGGWYYQTITDAIHNEGDKMELLDVLAKDVGIIGIFSDWRAPSRTTRAAWGCLETLS